MGLRSSKDPPPKRRKRRTTSATSKIKAQLPSSPINKGKEKTQEEYNLLHSEGPLEEVNLYSSSSQSEIKEKEHFYDNTDPCELYFVGNMKDDIGLMIREVIIEAEIRHLTTIIEKYNQKKSEDKLLINRKKTIGINFVIIAKNAIPEHSISIGVNETAREVAEQLYKTSGFCKYGTEVRKWAKFVQTVLYSDYKPDDFWNMLCFFTDKFERSIYSVDAINDWHPFENRDYWRGKVINFGSREDFQELYGIVGVVLRTIIVNRPNIYLVAQKE